MGRRGSVLIWTAIFTIGVAVQTATTYSIVQITIGRFIAGLGVGALSGLSPSLSPTFHVNRSFKSHRASLQRRDGTEIHSWNDARAVSAPDHHWDFLELHHRSWNPYHRKLGILAYPGRLADAMGANFALGYLLFARITVGGFSPMYCTILYLCSVIDDR